MATSRLSGLAALCLLLGAPALALESTIAQEGLLFDADGNPLEGEHTITVRLWDREAGGDPLFTENHRVTLELGWYMIPVGGIEDFPDDLFLREALWLSVAIDRGADLVPRTPLRKVPGAFVADVALDVVGDIHPRSVSVGGGVVIDENGRWVGDRAGLVGPRGPQGPAGGDGSPDTPEQVRDKLLQVDGAGSGVDADRLDGISADGFLRADAAIDADTFGGLPLAAFVRTAAQILERLRTVDGPNSGLDADLLDGFDSVDFVRTAAQILERLRTVDGADSGLDADRIDGFDSSEFVRTAAQILERLRTVDGANSGLDADRIDGLDSSELLLTPARILERLRSVDGAGSGLDADRLDGVDSSQFVRSAEQVRDLLRGVDGTGSGIDADLLDGLDSGVFMRTNANTGTSGTLSVAALLTASAGVRVGDHEGDCDDGKSGLIRWNGERMEFCDGETWRAFGVGAAGGGDGRDGRSRAGAAVDCQAVLVGGHSRGNGIYWIDPNGGATDDAFQIYCNMSSAGGGWTLALRSNVNNDEWHYQSRHWTEGTTMRPDVLDLVGVSNSKYSTFNTMEVAEILLVAQNGQERSFTLSPSRKGRTLLQLTSAGRDQAGNDETLENIHGRRYDNSYLFPDVRINGHEHFICHRLAFNSNHFGGGCHNVARIGYSMSQEYGCGHPGSAEGLGMHESCANDRLGSGRLQWAGEENFFRRMVVYVRGDPPPPPPTDDRSCSHIKAKQPNADNGVYSIDPDGDGGRAPFRVYCDMDAAGGGWTLVMKSNTNNTDLHYASPHWLRDTTLRAGDFALDAGNSKYESFNRMPVQELMIRAENGQVRTFRLSNSRRGRTMLQLTSAGYDREGNDETLEDVHGRRYDNSYLFPDVRIDGHEHFICHRLAFNSNHYPGGCHNVARVGYSMSQEYGCGHPGTAEGFGMHEQCHNDNLGSGRLQWDGERNYFRRAQLYIRAEAPALGEGRTCKAIKAADGDAPSGVYEIDPTGGNPFEAYCDMTTEGGGWTAIWKNHGGARGGERSNAQVLSQAGVELMRPHEDDLVSGKHEAAFRHYWNLRGTQWMKKTTLWRNDDSVRNRQSIRVVMGNVTMQQVFSIGVTRCHQVGNQMAVFVNGEAAGSTDRLNHYAGSTYGLANSGHGAADNCGLNNDNLINDGGGLFRLDGGNGLNAIRHLFSYVHTARGRDSSRCLYACWNGNSFGGHYDGFTWYVREQ